MICKICPRQCGVNRDIKSGFCKCGTEFAVARAAKHFWEEPCISGGNGSGAIFFSGCTLRCVFCQNHEISQHIKGKFLKESDFITVCKQLEDSGIENINLVNPTQYTQQLYDAFCKYRPSVPIIWNSGGYERAESLKMMQGIVDVYLPDLKYFDASISLKYAGVSDYFAYASTAIKEMTYQTGPAVFDHRGILIKGTLIRHLVLPANIHQSLKILDWIAQSLPGETYISLMSQYFPTAQAFTYPEIARRLRYSEYKRVVQYAYKLGLYNVYTQKMSSATSDFVPLFDL